MSKKKLANIFYVSQMKIEKKTFSLFFWGNIFFIKMHKTSSKWFFQLKSKMKKNKLQKKIIKILKMLK